MFDDKNLNVDCSDLDVNSVVQLYGIYESEWEHRDDIMWRIAFKLFNLSLFISIIPYIQEYFEIYLPMTPIFFPITGFFVGLYFLIVTLSYAARLNSISNSLFKLNSLLPEQVQRTPVSESTITKIEVFFIGKLVKAISKQYIAIWTPFVMELFLVVIQVVAIVFMNN